MSFPCPQCGESVREGRHSCPHCGASDEDGWSERTDDYADDDDFDYQEYVQREFGDQTEFGDPNRPRPTLWRGVIKLVLWLLVAAMVLGILGPLLL